MANVSLHEVSVFCHYKTRSVIVKGKELKFVKLPPVIVTVGPPMFLSYTYHIYLLVLCKCVQWSLYFKTTHGTKKMWSYIASGLKIKVILHRKLPFGTKSSGLIINGGLKIEGCKMEGVCNTGWTGMPRSTFPSLHRNMNVFAQALSTEALLLSVHCYSIMVECNVIARV